MFSDKQVKKVMTRLIEDEINFNGYDREEAEFYTEGIDYHELAEAVRRNARIVRVYTTQGKHDFSFNFRGKKLFQQRAARLFEQFVSSTAEVCVTDHYYELWLLADGSLHGVSRISVSYADGAYVTEYRESLGKHWRDKICVDLETLHSKLAEQY